MSNNGGSNINAFLIGLIVGGVLGVLFAPDEGENTRKKLKSGYKDWSRKALDVAQDLGEDIGPYVEEAVEAAAPVIQEIRPMVGEPEGADQPASPSQGGPASPSQGGPASPSQGGSCSTCLGDDVADQGFPAARGGPGGAVNQVRNEVRKRIPRSRPRFFKGV